MSNRQFYIRKYFYPGVDNSIASGRGQKLSQMALSWVLHNPAVTTVLIGASRPEQIVENVACIEKADFAADEIAKIEKVLAQ